MTRGEKIQAAWWLRSGDGMAYSEVAARLGVDHSTVWGWLNPEGARAIDQRSNAKRGPAKRAWENEHDRGRCPCGSDLGVGASRRGFQTCDECCQEMKRIGRAMRMQPVYEMWHAGAALREIADVMSMTTRTAGYHVSIMRLEGWDMPYRRPGVHTRDHRDTQVAA